MKKKHAQTDETSNCRDKDRRKFQLPRRLNHAGTITTGPKKIEHQQNNLAQRYFAVDSPAAIYDRVCVKVDGPSH